MIYHNTIIVIEDHHVQFGLFHQIPGMPGPLLTTFLGVLLHHLPDGKHAGLIPGLVVGVCGLVNGEMSNKSRGNHGNITNNSGIDKIRVIKH